ncbi:MFS transporter [Pseudolabrys taiwanensis]|uniref:MFS transporter n=1 Tax=Pseudolabrys taiwanensis TaxID=331696 RepID=A0A345ZUE3_9HYPH|nr:MFS transporter [Pseudolabrys taiwanensis]AXK80540.1 MFS transporter [Pseudolabrys taiwanensis]
MAQPFVEPCSRGLIDAEPCPRLLGREIAPHHRRVVLAACVLASTMAFVDGSALTVALPKLRAAVGADLASVQWVLNGYVLVLAALTLIGGALADSYGKARILAVGCLVFAAASIACALAPNVGWLIAARIVQGIGAALLTPASLALIGATYPREERNRAVGVWAAASSLTTAAGPVFGGWLTETFGWQAVFWINPPLAVAAVALIYAYAPPDAREPRGFDALGAILIAGALGALAWGLSQIGGDTAGNTSAVWTVTAVGGALIAFIAYGVWERRAEHPMTPPRLARNRAFVGLNIATLLIYWGLALMFFLVPFDLIDRRGLSPAAAGAALLPFTLGVGLLSRPFGAAADAIGARTMLIAGPALAAAAFLWLAFGRQASTTWGVIAPMTLLGIAFAVLITPLTASVLSSVAETDEGLASGVNNAASRIAQLAGIALAAGAGSLVYGYAVTLAIAAALSAAGAVIMALTVPPAPPPPPDKRERGTAA